MKLMLLGLLIFLGTHLFTTMRVARAGMIAKIGEGPYKILYSVLSAIGLVMAAYGFGAWRAEGSMQLWFPPVWTKHLAIPLVLFACICITSAYPPTHLRIWLKHPMLVGVKTWALAHLMANGDLAGIVLFGSVLLWAVTSRISQKWRPPFSYPEPRLLADFIATAMGLILFWWLGTYFHPRVVGLSVLPS
jgi:uncharacterized membrane protein